MSGINIQYSKNNIIEDNIISNFYQGGIDLYHVSWSKISNNTISNIDDDIGIACAEFTFEIDIVGNTKLVIQRIQCGIICSGFFLSEEICVHFYLYFSMMSN